MFSGQIGCALPDDTTFPRVIAEIDLDAPRDSLCNIYRVVLALSKRGATTGEVRPIVEMREGQDSMDAPIWSTDVSDFAKDHIIALMAQALRHPCNKDNSQITIPDP